MSHKTIFAKLSGTCLSHGSYGVYMAVTGPMWLLRIYVPLFCAKSPLRGSYETDLCEDMTQAFDVFAGYCPDD